MPKMTPDPKALAGEIAEANDTDIYLFAGPIYFPSDRKFSKCVGANRCRKNATLLLATFGGDADVAYHLARSLQFAYPDGSVSLIVADYCKSAGTLLAIGANELVMADNSELGPLDVQIAKKDSLVERFSGLTPVQSLETLRGEAFKCFEKCLLDVVNRSKGRISTNTAATIAVRLAAGLFRPIYAQIEPFQLGEYGRSLLVADQYGKRLDKRFKNLKPDGLDRLIADYPSHEFVIDRPEAETLFRRVRQPTEKESALTGLVEPIIWVALQQEDTPAIQCLSPAKAGKGGDKHDESPRNKSGMVSSPPGGAGRRTTAPSSPSGKPNGGAGRRERAPASTGDGMSSGE